MDLPSHPLPKEFARRMSELLGESTAFFEAIDTPSITSLRINSRKPAGVPGETSIPWCPAGRLLPVRPSFIADPLFHAGAYYVQESSSMFLDWMLRQLYTENPPERVLDLCAAPGGKSTLINDFLPNSSLLVSNEIIKSRTPVLAENLAKWGRCNHVITALDPAVWGRKKRYFDLLTIDAPCSGEGLFRKDQSARAEWTPQLPGFCSARQRRILEDAEGCLKPGGILIYSTCTFAPEENEKLIEKFLLEHPYYSTISISLPPGSGITVTEIAGKPAGYRFYPHLVPGEGLFICALRKEDEGNSDDYRKLKQRSRKQSATYVKAEVEELRTLVTGDTSFDFVKMGDAYHLIPGALNEAVEDLMADPGVWRAGLPIAEFKKGKVIPAPEWAFSVNRNPESFPAAELDLRGTLDFLKRTGPADLGTSATGQVLITHKGLGLGWVNMLPDRFNNRYPKEWAIRKDI